jgi:hypothetical protein
MNLFVVGWSSRRAPDPRRAEAAVRDLAGALPFLDGAEVGTWHAPSGAAAAAWASDPGEPPSPVSYAAAEEERLMLWAGRPVRWDAAGGADGRTPLDPGFYIPPAHHWAGALDGRFTAIRYDDADRSLAALADAMGAYPLYLTDVDGVTWISNRAEPLRALAGSRAVDLDSLAALLGGGWPLGGRPVWAAVRRVAPGLLSLHPEGGEGHRDLLLASDVARMCGAGFDPLVAARTLVDSVRALADWPGRPSVVPVTGGRDSRLVLAGALRAGIAFDAVTGGAPGSPDVVTARAVCEAAGIEHQLLPANPHGDPWSTPVVAARVLGLTTSGTASLGDAAGFPLGPAAGPPALWHSGQGGEIARGYYRSAAGRDGDAVVAGLERLFCGRRPGRSEPLSEWGRERVRAGIAGWVEGRLAGGAAPEDLPDLFYVDERMGSWAGPTHGAVEWVRDTTSPLWGARMLPHLLGPSVAEREAETFHAAVLRELAPELVDVPYAGGSKGGLRHKARRAMEEARRRVAPARAEPGGDPFDGVLGVVREAVAAQPDHVAWQVLDRERVDGLLVGDAGGLDEMSRNYVWRMATVFLDPALAEGHA